MLINLLLVANTVRALSASFNHTTIVYDEKVFFCWFAGLRALSFRFTRSRLHSRAGAKEASSPRALLLSSLLLYGVKIPLPPVR